MQLFSKEHYELLAQFEKQNNLTEDAREKDQEWWKRGYVYSNGETNRDFISYRKGYSFGKLIAQQADE